MTNATLVLERAQSEQTDRQQHRAKNDRLCLRNNVCYVTQQLLRQQRSEAEQKAYERCQRLDGNKPANQRGNWQRQASQPKATTDSWQLHAH